MSEDSDRVELYEARVLKKHYSDDDWSLTGYTSELRRRDNDQFWAIVDFDANDEGTPRFCEHCLQVGDMRNPLGRKIKKHGEQSAPDDDQWLSCYECGRTYPVYETFTESEIKDSLETSANPFDDESIFLTTETRKDQRRKGKKRKGRFSHLQEDSDSDPDIQREINQHGQHNVHIIY